MGPTRENKGEYYALVVLASAAMMVMAEGVKKAKSFDAAKVAAAIRELDFSAPIGRMSFDSQGDLKAPQIYVFQVRNAEFVQVFPE